METIKQPEARLLFETKQSNAFRFKRNEARSIKEQKAWQTLIDLADQSKKELKTKIEIMKAGLKKPSVRGLKTVCTRVVKATGLKVDGTLKKGYKYIKGGKVVKVAQPKKPVKKRVVKRVAKAKTPKRRVVRKRKVRRAA